jgi:transposase
VAGGGHQRRASAAKRSIGRSWVVPCTRTSATSACQACNLLVEVLQVTEAAARHEVALDVLHPGLDLALGLRPVRLAQPRREAPVARAKASKVGFSRGLPSAVPVHHGAHAVVQDLAAATEVGEGSLRGPPAGRQMRSSQESLRVAAPAVAQGHDEHVHSAVRTRPAAPDLAPVDLGLLARSGLEAALRQRGHRGGQTQRRHRATHDHVAAGKPALRTQLLPQDARRVVDLGRALCHPLAVLVQQAGRALAHSLNANMLRKWVIDAEHKGVAPVAAKPAEISKPASMQTPTFVPLALPAPVVDGEIRIELHRTGTTIKIVWPAAAASDCAAWLRDWLR